MNKIITEADVRAITKAGFSNDEGETHVRELTNSVYSVANNTLHCLHRDIDTEDLLIYVIHQLNSNFIHIYTPHRVVFFNHLKAIEKAIELGLVTHRDTTIEYPHNIPYTRWTDYLEWEQKPPKKEGLYWFSEHNEWSNIFMVGIEWITTDDDKVNLRMSRIGKDGYEGLPVDGWWLGPLSYPQQPPKLEKLRSGL